MKILIETDRHFSELFIAHVREMFSRGGNAVLQIQDVQESVDEGSPIDIEASHAREALGNFWIRRTDWSVK